MPPSNNDSDKASSSQTRRRLVLLAALLVGMSAIAWGVWTYAPWWTPPPDEVLQIGVGQGLPPVAVDVFWPSPALAERCSAVLLLPGVEGAEYGAPQHYSRARQLANDGHAVFVLHYLEPCGYKDLFLLTEDNKLDKDRVDAVIRRDHERWHDTVMHALDHIAGRDEIDAQRIGVLGYSLGCFVGISACDAANRDESLPDIAAFVGNWGSRYEHVQCNDTFPACRFFHGEADDIVPVAWPQQFVGELQAAGVDVQLGVFPGEGHVVRHQAAWRETRAFCKQKLGAPSVSHDSLDLSLAGAPTVPRTLEFRNLVY